GGRAGPARRRRRRWRLGIRVVVMVSADSNDCRRRPIGTGPRRGCARVCTPCGAPGHGGIIPAGVLFVIRLFTYLKYEIGRKTGSEYSTFINYCARGPFQRGARLAVSNFGGVSSMARQQERARRTRAAIIRSAAVEFGKSGYAAASLNRILEGSRATKGAMYFHFDSKEELAKAVLETAVERYRATAERWLARTDLGPLDILHGMIDELALRLQHDIIVQAEYRLIIEPDFFRDVRAGAGRILVRAV